ncbi:MAG: DUF507 family protein [Deltaproteobacteria bacterium]|nr:DUF507 family protein [Deltaproteobacteria bacterium]
MKVSEKQIEQMATAVVEGLLEGGLAHPRGTRADLEAAVRDVLRADLRGEADLDQEVERLLEVHADRLDEEGADYRRMFNMLKQKLARERGIVI